MTRKCGGKSAGRGADGRFGPGNPGKPKGAVHRATRAAQALLDGQAEALTTKCVEMALAGDATAMRLAMERLVPVRRERTLDLPDLPAAKGLTGLAQTMARLLLALGQGEITPGEAAEVGKLLEGHRRLVESEELEKRIAALEDRLGGQSR